MLPKHPPWDGIQFHPSSGFSAIRLHFYPHAFHSISFLSPILKCLLLLSAVMRDASSISKTAVFLFCFFFHLGSQTQTL